LKTAKPVPILKRPPAIQTGGLKTGASHIESEEEKQQREEEEEQQQREEEEEQRQREEEEQQQREEEELQQREELQDQDMQQLSPEPNRKRRLPTASSAPVRIPTKAAAISTQRRASAPPEKKARSAAPLDDEQLSLARGFAGGDMTKYVEFCNWLRAGGVPSAAPAAAPAAAAAAAPAVAFAPAFLQQANAFAGTDARKFEHFSQMLQAPVAAASAPMDVDMVRQIVQQTMQAQQQSPPRMGRTDLLQTWSSPQAQPSFLQGQETGLQQMAWATTANTAAMMQGFFMNMRGR